MKTTGITYSAGPEVERIHQLKMSSRLQELDDDLNNAQTEDAWDLIWSVVGHTLLHYAGQAPTNPKNCWK